LLGAAGCAGLGAAAYLLAAPFRPAAEPEHLVEYRRGCEALRERKYTDAGGHFSRALRAKSDHWPSLYGTGRALLGQGEVQEALWAFRDAAAAPRPDGQTLACLAYCYAWLGHHGAAEMEADKTLAQEDVPSADFKPAVYNNRAFSRLQTGKLDEAGADLARVFALADPAPATAYYIRALVAYQIWLRTPQPPLPDAIFRDLDVALRRLGNSPELLYDAALFHAWTSTKPGDEGEQKTLAYLYRALRAGLDPARVGREPIPAVQRLVHHPLLWNLPPMPQHQPGERIDPNALRLIDPAPEPLL
jgi:tetratricopeptide (TPR) repeat protein